ncbi:MAG: LTA synthase family protein [Prevotella sp.]|nr:LTA synthase family protein [Prevotella sp.]
MKASEESGHSVLYVLISFLVTYIIVGFLLRIVLIATSPADASYTVGEVIRSFSVGVLSDLGMGVLLCVPMAVIAPGHNAWKYRRPWNGVFVAIWWLAFLYSWMPFSIFRQYGGGAPMVARVFFGWKAISFSLRCLLPRIRQAWRRVSVYALWGVYTFLLLCVSAGEFFFWQEFGVRYNFIAVDYLVYTNEVIGNIMESYHIVPLMAVLIALTALIIGLQKRLFHLHLDRDCSWRPLVRSEVWYVVCGLCGLGLVSWTHGLDSGDQYVNQLEQNGACDFVIAFRSNTLDYKKFYALMPQKACVAEYRRLAGLDTHHEKVLGDSLTPQRKNIVLITVESLSADFLTRYGNRNRITPNLDRLIGESMVFDSLYACGNRTVRGLEALSLCIPPSAGESIIKRPENRMGSLSVGAVLRKEGYNVQFLYGGDSYFDNMRGYFSHNGYTVIDRAAIAQKDIHFANIWGVCDEDIFDKSLQVFDADSHQGKPFFAQIMTTSNHRPYTYPEGRIRYAGDPQCRDAAVKYTDYAIGRFLRQAKEKSWFRNTVFVIIADHCASSAGKTSIPVEKYHIPCLIYSPGFIVPTAFKKTCSQIDVMPTLLSMLHLRTRVRFAGTDVLAPHYAPRAFMATYQDLGFLERNILTVLSPVRRVRQYRVRWQHDGTTDERPLSHADQAAAYKARAWYQYVNTMIK